MGLLTYTAGWATVGFGVRIYQLGVMRRGLFESKLLGKYDLGSKRNERFQLLTCLSVIWFF